MTYSPTRPLSLSVFVALGLLAVAPGARASTTFDYTSGAFVGTKLANDGYPSDYDTLTLLQTSGTLDLTPGVAQTFTLNDLLFGVGYSSYAVYSRRGTATELFALGGAAQDLSETYVATSNYVQTGDELQFLAGTPTVLTVAGGTVTITPQAYTLSGQGISDTSPGALSATALYSPGVVTPHSESAAPESSGVAMLAVAGVCLGGLILRARRAGTVAA